MPQPTCSIDGCDTPAKKRGWCGMHYLRWYKHGDPLVTLPAVRPRIDPALRFWEKVDRNGPIPKDRPDLGPCWLWTASLNQDGYGFFASGHTSAHRAAYLFLVGEIPDGFELDHLCRNRLCCNPAHLEPVPHVVNVRRGASGQRQRAKTHCPQGHPYDVANTYVYDGERQCRICRRAAVAKSQANRRCRPRT